MPWRFLDKWYEESDDKSKEDFNDWLISIEKIAKILLMKKVNLVISTPTPEFPDALYRICKSQNMQWFNKNNKKDCFYDLDFYTSYDGKFSNIIEDLRNISFRNENLYLFNSLEAMCPNSRCSYSKDGRSLYKDDDHISNYSAKYIIAPKILDFIEKNKI